MREFVFLELCPKKRLITGKEAKKLEVLIKGLLEESADKKTKRCPVCGGNLCSLGGENLFCVDCEWDNLS